MWVRCKSLDLKATWQVLQVKGWVDWPLIVSDIVLSSVLYLSKKEFGKYVVGRGGGRICSGRLIGDSMDSYKFNF
jgi:hypothetical protein